MREERKVNSKRKIKEEEENRTGKRGRRVIQGTLSEKYECRNLRLKNNNKRVRIEIEYTGRLLPSIRIFDREQHQANKKEEGYTLSL